MSTLDGKYSKDLSRKSTVTGARNYLKTIECPYEIDINLLQTRLIFFKDLYHFVLPSKAEIEKYQSRIVYSGGKLEITVPESVLPWPYGARGLCYV